MVPVESLWNRIGLANLRPSPLGPFCFSRKVHFQSNTMSRIISIFVRSVKATFYFSAKSSLAVHNELRHGITVHAARELLLLHHGKEQGDKLLDESRSNGLSLCHTRLLDVFHQS